MGMKQMHLKKINKINLICIFLLLDNKFQLRKKIKEFFKKILKKII